MFLLAGLLVSGVCVAAVASPRTNLFSSISAWVRNRISRSQTLAPVHVDKGWTVIPSDDEKLFTDWIHDDDFKRSDNPQIFPALGSHLLVELYGCERNKLELQHTVEEAMLDAARRSEASIVTSSFHEFRPYGVSGAVIIEESHYTIHTWPEHGYAAVDLFYCSESVKVDKAVEALSEHFRPTRTRFLVVRRGLQPEVDR